MPELPAQMFRCPLCSSKVTLFQDKSTDPAFCPVCSFPMSGETAVALGDINLQKYIELCSSRLVICFHAPWDDVSRDFMPIFDELSLPVRKYAVLISVDISHNPEVARHFGIQMLPTLVIVEGHREVNRIIGALSRYDLSRIVSEGMM
jgi:thioredoxin 2